MKVLILIPAYNEAGSLPAVVAELRQWRPDHHILVIDDGSTDDTADLIDTLPVEHLSLSSRVGLGGAMRAGFRYAAAEGFDTVVRIDGDGQHNAESVQALLEPLIGGQADVVRGSRYLLASNYRAVGFRRMAQQVIAQLLSAVTGETVTDPTCGFWAFGPRAVRLLAHHHPSGYPEPELSLLLHRNHLKTVEVPVKMRERIAGRTSLGATRTALAMARVMLALLIVPLRPVVDGRSL